MKSPANRFYALKTAQRRQVHFTLCQYALRRWNDYANAQGTIRYIDTVVGTRQEVDIQLPADALEAARQGRDLANIAARYQEPIVAMQDDDLTFPEPIEFAYYAIYNLFGKYALAQDIDDWLIVNQALSPTEESDQWHSLLDGAIQQIG